ncbi:hypothetical protein C8F04DRAFT_1302506 [Mycena alexandri]|uniref:Uncharacterized protein n=1 Tax=Mycena alexandri TaxID=1745969 RepID=A0AAD6SB66_9AGAR|nr:hypothetical protein C8F04DRAFT_1302506 [Mycena alexandri]
MEPQATRAPRFAFTRRIKLPDSTPTTPKRGAVQFFPWTIDSAQEIFNGKWRGSDRWLEMVAEFSDALAVARGSRLVVVGTDMMPLCFSFATDPPSDEKPQVAWALRSARPFDPLVLVAHTRRIFIWNVNRQALVGCVRDHGGRITSVAVHPTSPNFFATTSSDFTTRIYNLDLQVLVNHANPNWPPWKGGSEASAAHGTDGSDAKGPEYGIGRCVQLLVGGRSGGHAWDVLSAAFHPRLPLLATCGADRCVKIWRTLPDRNETNLELIRADKPLFSARITTSRVLSVAWLPEDLLLIHTATTYTPVKTGLENQEDLFDEDEDEEPFESDSVIKAGSIDVFQWLGLKRFFPSSDFASSPVTRGVASDYQESTSYTLISTEPLSTDHLSTPKDEGFEEPISTISHPQPLGRLGHFLLVYPRSMGIVILDSAKLSPLTQDFINEDTLVEMTKRIRLDESPESDFPPPARVRVLPFSDQNMGSATELTACTLGPSGTVAILDDTGTVWLFVEQTIV